MRSFNNDPLHATVVLRRKESFKGSGLSLHVYPDGMVVPSSKSKFPALQLGPATREEIGDENAHWLDPNYVSKWQADNEAKAAAGAKKGKGKGKSKTDFFNRSSSGKCSSSSSSKRHSKSEASDSG